MAVGFTPKYTREEIIGGFTPEQLLILSIEAANALEWKTILSASNGLKAYTSISMWTSNEEVTVKIDGNKLKVKSKSTGSEMFDMNRNKKHVTNFFDKIYEIKSYKTTEELNASYEEKASMFTQEEYDHLNEPPKTTGEEVKSFFSLFIPTKELFITPLLIDLNCIIFILMLFNGVGFVESDNQILINWGANFKPLTIDNNEWWRLFTSTFLHAGVIHLLMNMYALLYIGVLLEPLLGKINFSVFYILTGIAASTTSLYWHDFNVCVGASGAIFGLYGIFLSMLTTNILHKSERMPFLMSIGFFVVYNLVYGIQGNTDNAAHIGGLLSGVVFGYALYFIIKEKENTKIAFSIVSLSIIVTGISIAVAIKNMPKNFAIYQKKIEEFQKYEKEAMAVYADSTMDLTLLTKELNDGIDKWEKCYKIIDTLRELDLPVEYTIKNNDLEEYVKLRIETYEMILQPDSVSEKEIQIKYDKIDSIIKKIDNE
jgi:rhomboid protease GluP